MHAFPSGPRPTNPGLVLYRQGRPSPPADVRLIQRISLREKISAAGSDAFVRHCEILIGVILQQCRRRRC